MLRPDMVSFLLQTDTLYENNLRLVRIETIIRIPVTPISCLNVGFTGNYYLQVEEEHYVRCSKHIRHCEYII